nr:hypothetical protein [Tanacetum cinerariifolium]
LFTKFLFSSCFCTGMDLLAFIRTADPTKVRVAERQRAEDEPRVLESTVGHVVPLLPIAPARASSELEASVDRLLMRGLVGMDKMLMFSPFVFSSDSSHYSGANIAEAEVDSIIRSFAPAIATVTNVTTAIDTEATA